MNITELKKNTWYRCYPFNNSDYWYIKTTENGNARKVNEWVNNKGEYVTDDSFENFSDYSDFKGGYHEATLEEINKYLPKDKQIIMSYTEDNIIGLEIIHRDGSCSYRVVKVVNSKVSTQRIHDGNKVDEDWTDVKKVNKWIKDGIWIVINHPIYEIY